jgi:glycosyltransferase involved in cell wall biosynthesis
MRRRYRGTVKGSDAPESRRMQRLLAAPPGKAVTVPGLKILLTNTHLDHRGGTELYIRDLATALVRLGHNPVVYSPRLGGVAAEIRALSIPVVDTLDAVGEPPDLIHGQHHLETMAALWAFPETPALYVSHGYLPWQEAPPLFPRILHYVVVGVFGRDRLTREFGIDPDRISVVPNFVDLRRFRQRSELAIADRPRRALLFGNWPSAPYRDAVRNACADRSITLDTAGLGLGTVTDRPEALLHRYDLVFAVGRSALEAMATGAAVILASPAGIGPLVTTRNVDWLRSINFAIRALTQPCDPRVIGAEIDAYDASDALLVSETVLQMAGLDDTVDEIVALYEDVLTRWRATTRDLAAEERATAAYLHWVSQSILPGLSGDLHQSEAERERLRAENAGLVEEVRRIRHAQFPSQE